MSVGCVMCCLIAGILVLEEPTFPTHTGFLRIQNSLIKGLSALPCYFGGVFCTQRTPDTLCLSMSELLQQELKSEAKGVGSADQALSTRKQC